MDAKQFRTVSPPATLPVACASLKIISSSAVKGMTSVRPAAYGRGTLDELSGVFRPEREPPAVHAAQQPSAHADTPFTPGRSPASTAGSCADDLIHELCEHQQR